jgi:hypothetical protein
MVFLPKTKADGAGGFTSCFLIGHGNTLLLYEQEGKSFLSEAIAKQWAEATARRMEEACEHILAVNGYTLKK